MKNKCCKWREETFVHINSIFKSTGSLILCTIYTLIFLLANWIQIHRCKQQLRNKPFKISRWNLITLLCDYLKTDWLWYRPDSLITCQLYLMTVKMILEYVGKLSNVLIYSSIYKNCFQNASSPDPALYGDTTFHYIFRHYFSITTTFQLRPPFKALSKKYDGV